MGRPRFKALQFEKSKNFYYNFLWKEVKKMLKMNMETSIDNINFLRFINKQSNNEGESEEIENNIWSLREPLTQENTKQ